MGKLSRRRRSRARVTGRPEWQGLRRDLRRALRYAWQRSASRRRCRPWPAGSQKPVNPGASVRRRLGSDPEHGLEVGQILLPVQWAEAGPACGDEVGQRGKIVSRRRVGHGGPATDQRFGNAQLGGQAAPADRKPLENEVEFSREIRRRAVAGSTGAKARVSRSPERPAPEIAVLTPGWDPASEPAGPRRGGRWGPCSQARRGWV